jgi:hypothetical protein
MPAPEPPLAGRQEPELEPWGYVTAPELRDGSRSHGDMWWPYSWEIGAGATGTRGSPGAAPSREPEPWGHAVAWSYPKPGGGS